MPTAELMKGLKDLTPHSGEEWVLFLPPESETRERFVVLVAHADCWRDPEPDDELVWSSNVEGQTTLSRLDRNGREAVLGGDDRAGVYAVLRIFQESMGQPWQPAVLLCDAEEKGKLGAKEAAQALKGTLAPQALCLLELDMAGVDQVNFYNNEPLEFIDGVQSFGLKRKLGPGTDIMELCRTFSVAGACTSIGYHEPHCPQEYLVIEDLEECLERAKRMVKHFAEMGKRWEL
jgi:hypothetical protein